MKCYVRFTIYGLVVFLCLGQAKIALAAAPTIDTTTAAQTSGGNESSFNLTASTTTTLYVHGSITDADGCDDVATNGTVTGKFYRSNLAAAETCTVDNNDCYPLLNANCIKTGCTGPTDNTFDYECTAAVQYYADSTTAGPHTNTNWTAMLKATDQGTNTGTKTDTIEMNTLIGLEIPTSVSYGVFALDTVGPEQTFTVTNSGNSGMDLRLKVDGAMRCTGTGSANIPVGNVHYAGTTGVQWSDGTAFTTSFVDYQLNLGPRTDDAAAITKNLYFKLRMPTAGIGGNCSNTITGAAIADTGNGW